MMGSLERFKNMTTRFKTPGRLKGTLRKVVGNVVLHAHGGENNRKALCFHRRAR